MNYEENIIRSLFPYFGNNFFPEDLERLKSLGEIIWGKDKKMPRKEWKEVQIAQQELVNRFS